MEINKKIRYLGVGLRMLGVTLDDRTLKKIILITELIDAKGGNTNMSEVLDINDKL